MQQATSVMYLAANSIVNASREAEAGSSQQKSEYDCQEEEDDQEERALVEGVCRHEDPLSLIVASFAPRIYGHELVKLGLLLGLFGGTDERAAVSEDADADGSAKRRREQDQAKESIQVRCNSHVLVVGDPGLGKSQMLRAAAAVAPRAVYVCGNTTTTTGLTVSLTREGKSGAPALEAGAVVLGDRGACCIDEFDKMDSGQHAGLLEAMEQQQISIAKAGVVATLQARTAILAAANPAGGSYDRARTVAENVRLSAPYCRDLTWCFCWSTTRTKVEMNYCPDTCWTRTEARTRARGHLFVNVGRRAARRARACPRLMPRPSKRNCERAPTP